MEKWLKDLSKEDIDLRKIRSKPFQKIAQIAGTENAIKIFREFHGDWIAVGCEYLNDLEREYCRIFSSDRTVRELASILRVSPGTVNGYMNEPQKKYDLSIPMFRENM